MASKGRRRRRQKQIQSRRDLPEELLREILVRLPTKSLVRFQSVCKAWHSYFPDLYHLLRGGFRCSDLSFPHPKQDLCSMVPELADPPPSVMGSGILCLNSIHRTFSPPFTYKFALLNPTTVNVYNMYRHSISSTKFALLNPTTGNHIFTNPIPPHFSSAIPLSEPSEVVFGFGTRNSDYRVVVLIRYGPDFASSLVLLYSLNSGKWKKISSVIPQEARIASIHCNNQGRSGGLFRECFVSGCWHWMLRLDDGTYCVLSFNFEDEEFRLIGMPEPPKIILPYYPHLESKTFVVQERLAVIYMVSKELRVFRLDVWVMTEYGAEESWIRAYTAFPPVTFLMVTHFLRIDCRKDATAVAGFVVQRLYIRTNTRRGFKIICCNDDGSRFYFVSWDK